MILMNSHDQAPFEANAVPHPGETVLEYLDFHGWSQRKSDAGPFLVLPVLEYLDFHGWSQRDLARRTGLTPKTISEICNGKAPITPPTALAFEKVLERPAHLWLNLQRLFDEAEARERQLAKSQEWDDWVQNFPLKEMRRRRFSLPSGTSNVDVVLKFFGVSSPESWQSVWEASSVAFRQTRVFETRPECVAAWVRGMVCPPKSGPPEMGVPR
jgi:addiction module HigA family antidote